MQSALAQDRSEGLPEAFRILEQRNLFDPSRQPPRAAVPRTVPTVRPPATPPERTETLTLLGVAVTDLDAFAHVTGPAEGQRQVVRTGDTLADATVTAITRSGVTLETPQGVVDLRVGHQMTRTGSRPWRTGAAAAPPAATASTPSATGGTSTPASSGGDTMSEVMRRLMERRQREMQR